MKRSFICIAAAVICVMLAACGKPRIEAAGKDSIEALRKEAAAYESGRYFITNVETGAVEQVFTFMYDTDGTQIYLCEGVQNGSYYAEYSNGKELFREENGVGRLVPSSEDGFAVYSRKKPHPYSTGQLFFYVKEYIGSSEEITDEAGHSVYVYYYDTEKLNKALGGSLTSFVTSYAFDTDGSFLYFRQHNSSAPRDGAAESYTYEITVSEINSVTEVENPVIIE